MIQRNTNKYTMPVMDTFRTISPTESYEMDIPEDAVEDIDGNVTSYWRSGEDVLLQVSSYRRIEGEQVVAKQRLSERFTCESLVDVAEEDLGLENCPDIAAVSGTDDQGVRWIYCYAVWPDLTVFVSVSGQSSELRKHDNWALRTVRSIRRIV